MEASTLAHPDHTWVATADDDTTVAPRPDDSATVDAGLLAVRVPALSWSMVRLAPDPGA